MLNAVQKDLHASAEKLLQMTPLEILLEGWKKYREVSMALEDSRKKPNEPILKALIKHTIKSEHHPYIELVLDEIPAWKIEFGINAALEVEGAQLKIQNGQVTYILSGTAAGTFKFSCGEHLLTEAKTGKFNLPGEIRLKSSPPKSLAVAPQKSLAGGARLTGLNGEVAGRNFPLADGATIGRSTENMIQLADRTVSRHHAHFRCAANQWYIQNEVNSSGMLVNGKPVDASALHEGDLIQIGDYQFEFHAR